MNIQTLKGLSENVDYIPIHLDNAWKLYVQQRSTVIPASTTPSSPILLSSPSSPQIIASLRNILNQCMQIIANVESPQEIEDFFDQLRQSGLMHFGACDTTWNFGDTAYKCRTCQLDPTTALCISCFKAGDHIGHDYALQSVGGGFCDCGDPTAFKSSGFCQKHKEQTIDVTKYPKRFMVSLCYVIQFILQKVYYFFEQNREEEYEILMDWLLKLSQRGDVVKIIVIKYISNTDIGNTSTLPPSPFRPTSLLTKFYHPTSHALTSPQIKTTFVNFCVFLRGSVEFIESMIETVVPIYKQCIIEAKNHMILTSYTIFSSSSVEGLLLKLGAVHVVMDTINTYFRKHLASRAPFMRRRHMRIIRFKEEDVIDIPSYEAFLQVNTIPRPLHRLRTDIGFILSNLTISRSVLTDLHLLGEWFKMISLSQGMNPNVKYRSSMADEWVPAFGIDISLSSTLFSVLAAIEESSNLKSNDYKNFLLLASQYLGKWVLGWIQSAKDKQNEKETKKKNKWLEEKGEDTTEIYPEPVPLNPSQLIKATIPSEGFTYHLILQRVVAAFLLSSIKFFGTEYASKGGLKTLFESIIGERSPISMVDYTKCAITHPLKLFASLGEIKAGMWRGHGREEDMNLQTVMYQSLYYQRFFDLDMLLIQIGSILIGTPAFMDQVLTTYNLNDWFKLEPSNLSNKLDKEKEKEKEKEKDVSNTPPRPNLRQSTGGVKSTTTPATTTTTQTTSTSTVEQEKEKVKEDKKAKKLEEDLQKKKILAEDFVHFLIRVSTNKTLAGMTDEQIIRKELIHRLCLGDCTHSQLTRNIQRRLVNHPKFEQILLEIATFQNPQRTEQGKYQLKEAGWAEFDPYFAHYNTQDLQSAEERYSEFNNKTKSNIARGTFIQYTSLPCFEQIDNLLSSKLVHQVLFTILQNQLVGSEKSTETILSHSLNALELSILQSIKQRQLKGEPQPPVTPTKSNPSTTTTTPVGTSSQTSYETKATDIEYPSEDDIFINANCEVAVADGKRLSLMIILVKLSGNNLLSNEHKQHIQSILNLLMDNDMACKATVENYYAAIKAKKASQVASTPLKKEDPEEERKRMARARQAAILAQMKSQQNSFKFEDDEDYEDEDEQASIKAAEKAKEATNQLIVDGQLSTHTCALCREAGSLKRPMGRVAFIQPSSVLMLSKLTAEEKKQRMTKSILKELGESTKPSTTSTTSPAQNNAMMLQNTIHNALNDLLGQNEVDEDDMDTLNDVDMGSDDEDESDDEVSKAMSFLNKISNFGEYFDGMGGPVDMFGGGDDEEEDMEMDNYTEDEEDDEGLTDDSTSNSSSSSSSDSEVDNAMEDQLEDEFDEDGDDEDDHHHHHHHHGGRHHHHHHHPEIEIDDYYSSMDEDEYDDDEEEEYDDDEAIYDYTEGGQINNNNATTNPTTSTTSTAATTTPANNTAAVNIQNMFRNILFGGHPPPGAEGHDLEDDPNIFYDDYDEDEMVQGIDDNVAAVCGNPWSKRFTNQELFRNPEQSVNLHLSFCGHQIHEDCFNDYSWSTFKNQNEAEELIDSQKGEFLCVLCRRIGNALVPVIPDSSYGESPSQPQDNCGPVKNEAYIDFLRGLMHKLTTPVGADFEYPELLKPVREAIDQFASRIFSVRHQTVFYNSESNEKVLPFIGSSITSTIADTELAGRVTDDDSSNANTVNNYHLFSVSDSNRIDIRSLFRASVAHVIAHPPLNHEGVMLWKSLSGELATPLPIIEETATEEQREAAAKELEKAETESFPPFLSLDLFHTLIQLYLRTSSKDSYVKATDRFYTLLRLCFDAYLTQSVFERLNILNNESSSSTNKTDQFVTGVTQLITTPNENQQTLAAIPKEHTDAIKSHTVIFLRKAALFLYSCLNVNPPVLPATVSPATLNTNVDIETEYLLHYLKLSSNNTKSFESQLVDVVNTLITHSETLVPLVSKWSEQILSSYAIYISTSPPTESTDSTSKLELIPSPSIPKPLILIELPKLYSTLSQLYSTTPCLQCKTISNHQALCLVCGTLCCLGSCCKRVIDQKNECVLHAEKCNAGTCIFLVIKSSAILLIHQPRRTYWISPYLDDHGEEDINLRRGKTLYLNMNRYNQLNSLLLKHQIDQDSKIAELSSRE